MPPEGSGVFVAGFQLHVEAAPPLEFSQQAVAAEVDAALEADFAGIGRALGDADREAVEECGGPLVVAAARDPAKVAASARAAVKIPLRKGAAFFEELMLSLVSRDDLRSWSASGVRERRRRATKPR